MARDQLVLFLLILSAGLPGAVSKLARGRVNLAAAPWAFTERFCFASSGGRYDYRVTFELPSTVNTTFGSRDFPSLLVYTSFDDFRAVDSGAMACIDRVIAAPQSVALQPLLNLGCTSTAQAGTLQVSCSGGWDLLPGPTPRWWFVAVQCCGCATPPLVLYTQHFLNGNEKTTREFSEDQSGMLAIAAVFFVVFVLLSFLLFRFEAGLRARQAEPRLFQLLKLSCGLQVIGSMCGLIYAAEYARTGESASFVRPFGWFLEGCAFCVFVYLLILISKGVAITRAELSTFGRMKHALFFLAWAVAYVALVLVSASSLDDKYVLDRYDTAAGSALLALRMVACAWFSFAIFTTDARPNCCGPVVVLFPVLEQAQMSPRHRDFFVRIFCFFWVWLIALPLAVWTLFGLRLFSDSLLAAGSVASWTAPRAADAIENSIFLAGLLYLTYLFRPSAANKNFPFRIATDRIAVLVDAAAVTSFATALPPSAPIPSVLLPAGGRVPPTPAVTPTLTPASPRRSESGTPSTRALVASPVRSSAGSPLRPSPRQQPELTQFDSLQSATVAESILSVARPLDFVVESPLPPTPRRAFSLQSGGALSSQASSVLSPSATASPSPDDCPQTPAALLPRSFHTPVSSQSVA